MAWTLTGTRSSKSVQGGAEPDPSGAADGVALDFVGGMTVVVECAPGETFTGTGKFECFFYDPAVGDWAPNPDLDLLMDAASSGKRRRAFTGFRVDNPRGRVAWKRNGVGVSAGNVTIYVGCTNRHHLGDNL